MTIAFSLNCVLPLQTPLGNMVKDMWDKVNLMMQLGHRNPVTMVLHLFVTAFTVPWPNRP